MDFFGSQEQAHKRTRLLVMLFIAAVAALAVLTNLLLIAALELLQAIEGRGGLHYTAEAATWVSGGVIGIVLLVSLWKWAQLRQGGVRVAESLGGQRVQTNTDDADERRLLNVVEEMAIAAGMPIPRVYLLADEMGINAFAAGHSPADAVIGVTRGALLHFNRDQLQGVIAHEFSHILNGDMRLNIRLLALLHGITFIGLVGRWLIRSASYRSQRHSYYARFSTGSRRRNNPAAQLLLGAGLVFIGWLGQFCGGLIRAAVSRQREFLADASAVQFTRNPEGIGGALKLIGGHQGASYLEHPQGEALSHMFFGTALKNLGGGFATHPPLDERILRIEPQWDYEYIYPRPLETPEPETEKPAETDTDSRKQAVTEAVLTGTLGAGMGMNMGTEISGSETASADQLLHAIPQTLLAELKEPLGAYAAVVALLLSDEAELQTKQCSLLQQTGVQGLAELTCKLHPQVSQLSRALWFPLLEEASASLKSLSEEQYKVLRRTLLMLIRADGKTELWEWCLFQMLSHVLDSQYSERVAQPIKYKQAKAVTEPYAIVLSLLTETGTPDETDRSRAFYRGANTAGLYQLKPVDKLKISDFSQAVNQLALCAPPLKAKLLKGLVDAVRVDGEINVCERQMVQCIAVGMGEALGAAVLSRLEG